MNGKKKEISRKEVGRKVAGQSSSTKLGKKATAALTAYLKEMGVSEDVVGLMMSATPDNINIVPAAEALRTGLITDMLSYNEWPGMPLCAPDAAAEAVCHSHPVAEVACGGQGACISEAPVQECGCRDKRETA